MGTLYYAVNLHTKKAYELGKGAWFLLAPGHEEGKRIADVSDFTKTLDLVIRVIGDGTWNAKTVADTPYKEEITKALNGLGPVVEIRDDANWDDPTEGCEIVGTRYRDI